MFRRIPRQVADFGHTGAAGAMQGFEGGRQRAHLRTECYLFRPSGFPAATVTGCFELDDRARGEPHLPTRPLRRRSRLIPLSAERKQTPEIAPTFWHAGRDIV